MACTAADLINIQPLALSDTFNTWFDRTNNVIASVNDVNVFDVAVGPTNGGLIRETGCSSGFYNGVVTLYVNQVQVLVLEFLHSRITITKLLWMQLV